MSVTVELGSFTGFTLDSQTLGRLDVNKLDGSIEFVDVSTAFIRGSTRRGRNRDLGRTSAGGVSVSFRNEDRRFDPLNPNSDLGLYTVPRKPVRVSSDGTPVFTGLIDDWNFDYEIDGRSIASITGSDAFNLFAREIIAGTAVPEELSGARIETILDNTKIVWPTLDRDIDGGNATLAAGTAVGNALKYLQDVETSEAGLIFMTKDGKFGFRERLVAPDGSAVLLQDAFTDAGNGIPYQGIQISYGIESLVNDVTVTSAEGSATAEDTASQQSYGVTSEDISTLLASGSLQSLADYVVSRFAQPEYRIESVTVDLNKVTSVQKTEVLSLELGDVADVVFTPNAIPPAIALRNRIIGISHDITVDQHNVTLAFEELPFEFFIIDDDPFGRLDGDGVLGF
jgi:hypothetical protein